MNINKIYVYGDNNELGTFEQALEYALKWHGTAADKATKGKERLRRANIIAFEENNNFYCSTLVNYCELIAFDKRAEDALDICSIIARKFSTK